MDNSMNYIKENKKMKLETIVKNKNQKVMNNNFLILLFNSINISNFKSRTIRVKIIDRTYFYFFI